MTTSFIIALSIYVIFLMLVAELSSKKITSEEEFIVGGRSFNLWLTSFTLFATWFGAGTLVTATDEIAREGLFVTALEPYGAGACLLFAGLFFAKPLWEEKIFTMADFFKKKFGPKAESICVFMSVPIYVGWISVQLVAVANILSLYFSFPLWAMVLLVVLLICYLTVKGGMWSVSITDSVQLFIIVFGLFYLFYKITGGSAEAASGLLEEAENKRNLIAASERVNGIVSWLSVFFISSLGNLTGQDLGQRIFSARSSKVAVWGCLIAGAMYFVVGSIPVYLGLTASVTLGDFKGSVITNLVQSFLDPMTGIVLTITLISSVVSTLTSALLAPSTMLSHNFLSKVYPEVSPLYMCKISVFVVCGVSAVVAVLGEDVFAILEASYALGFVMFFAPLCIGIWSKKHSEAASVVAMVSGFLVWITEYMGLSDYPMSLWAVVVSFAAYFLTYSVLEKRKVSLARQSAQQ